MRLSERRVGPPTGCRNVPDEMLAAVAVYASLDPADLEGGANNEKRKAENAAAIDMIKARLKINMPE